MPRVYINTYVHSSNWHNPGRKKAFYHAEDKYEFYHFCAFRTKVTDFWWRRSGTNISTNTSVYNFPAPAWDTLNIILRQMYNSV